MNKFHVQPITETDKTIVGQIAHLEQVATRVDQAMVIMSKLGIELAQFPEMFNELVKRYVELQPKQRPASPGHLNHCNLNFPATIDSVDDYCSCQFHTVVAFPSDHVFTRRENGEALRKQWHLDGRDTNDEIVIVQIPDTMYTISSSFFIGLFADSLRKMGRERFKEKYRFVGSSKTDTIQDVLNVHIQTTLRWI